MLEQQDLSPEDKEAIANVDVDSLEYDDDRVTEVFVNVFDEASEKRDTSVADLCLCIFPWQKRENSKHRIRCKVISLSGKFAPEIVRIRQLTPIDMMGQISKAFMLLLDGERQDLDQAREHKHDLGKIEMYFQVVDGKLSINICYDKKFVRAFDLKKEFGNVNND